MNSNDLPTLCKKISQLLLVKIQFNSSRPNDAYMNYMNPGYFTLAVTGLKPQQMPMFLHISARVWGRQWSTHASEQKGFMLKPQ